MQPFTKTHIISTHTLTWSVTSVPQLLVIFLQFQLTRSRGAWLWQAEEVIREQQFQLTRSRGAWPLEYSDSRGQTGNFNSHAHVERDWNSFQWDYIPMIISTHTLTWSVTFHNFHRTHHIQNFNSHAHVERDARRLPVVEEQINFNSHAHVERDPCRLAKIWKCYYFNSHAHVERDWTV